MPPQVRHGGIGLARAYPREGALHRRALAARQARHLAHGAVDLDDAARVGARLLVEAVHVLGDEGVELARAARGGRAPGGRRWARPSTRAIRAGSARRAAGPRDRRRSAGASPSSRPSGRGVHRPCGPRKSGMPDSVEMPAPVRTTTRDAASTRRRAVLRSRHAAENSTEGTPRIGRGRRAARGLMASRATAAPSPRPPRCTPRADRGRRGRTPTCWPRGRRDPSRR